MPEISDMPNPDQISERPLLKLKVNYNEQFLLPDIEINPEATIDKSVFNHDWHSNDKLPRFEIEVQGHPGYLIEVRKGHSVDIETSTTVRGFILFSGRYELVTDPFTRVFGSYQDRTYFSPFGPANIESTTDVNEKGNLKLNVKKVPISIAVVLNDIWEATRGQDPTRVFLIYDNKALEGLPLPFHAIGEISKHFSVTSGRWINMRQNRPSLIVGQVSSSERESTLLLPSDPEFFKTAKILIGDKPPELKS